MKKSLVFFILPFFLILICVGELNSSQTILKAIDDHVIEAQAYFAQGKYPQALEAYHRAFRLDSRNARVLSGLGLVLDSFGQQHAALKFCENGSVLAPEDPEVYFRLGFVLANQRQYDKALENFLKTIHLDPYYPEAYFNTGVCYWHRQQYPQAVRFYQKFFEVHPGRATAHYLLGSLEIDRPDYSQEIESCLKAINTHGADAKIYGSLGVAYGQIGQYAKSIEYLLRAVEVSPGYAKGYYNLAVSYQRMNDFNQANYFYRRAIRLEPKYSFIFKPGLWGKSRGQYDKEVSNRQRSLAPLVYVGFAEAHYHLGRIYCLQKDGNGLQQQIEELEKLSRFDLVDDLNECR